MTRSMFDFLVQTLYVMPGLHPNELRRVCKQLHEDLKELVK